MAIFLASTKSISRGKGQSAVASASYRAGVTLEDKRYGKKHNYSKRHGVVSADIILPSALKDANSSIERGELWNMAEEAEKRKDARVGREWIINLPHELDRTTRKDLAHTFAQALADRYNIIADVCIHEPVIKKPYDLNKKQSYDRLKEKESNPDPRNFHAHIMLTTRQAELDDNGKIKLTHKATFELSDSKRRQLGLERVSEEIKYIRLLWEQIANETLEKYGHNLIDSRSYKEIGINIIPQIKIGREATSMERNGESTIKGDRNRMIIDYNNLVWSLQLAEHIKNNERVDQTISNKYKENEDDITIRIEGNKRGSQEATDNAKFTNRRIGRVKYRLDVSKHGIRDSYKRVARYEYETAKVTRRLSDSFEQKRRTDSIITNHFRPKATSSNSIRNRVIDTQRRIDETEREIYGTDQDIERIIRQVDLVINKKAKEIGWRFFRDYYILHHSGLVKINAEDSDKRLDARQEKILDEFSMLNDLASDTKDDVHTYKLKIVDFFRVRENIIKHESFISMLMNPNAERMEHSKRFSEAQQGRLDDLNGKDTSEGSRIQKNVPDVAYKPKF